MDFDDDHALCALRRRLPKDLHGQRCANKYPTLARAEIPTQHIFGVFNGRDAGPE
jgi:hypothetical protein